ncbi:MAG: DegT/DnrJ/EryC1/StrS family aminotransferase, partial [Candidatus Thermoplasmatota archaeon]|nr:DegT/DnrJ/EryC1/StrS family aminotransferase [Candidatus Thermoplasmatota archaeon]
YNYKMSDITAAVGLAQMGKIEKIIGRKQELAKIWDERLNEIKGIAPPFVSKGVRHVYQAYVPILDKKINRNLLIERLRQEGVQAQIGTYSSFIQPVYKSKNKCPTSLEIFNRTIALPLYYGMTEADVHLAADVVKNEMERLLCR